MQNCCHASDTQASGTTCLRHAIGPSNAYGVTVEASVSEGQFLR